MDKHKRYILDEIKACLDYHGIKSTIRDDRRDGPYINIGDYRHVADRAQFWVDINTNAVKFWVGINMGRMYSASVDSPFRRKWDTEKYHEIHLVFPHLFLAIDFIKDLK